MNSEALQLFSLVCTAAVPYAITWRIGVWIINTMLDFVTGRSDRL